MIPWCLCSDQQCRRNQDDVLVSRSKLHDVAEGLQAAARSLLEIAGYNIAQTSPAVALFDTSAVTRLHEGYVLCVDQECSVQSVTGIRHAHRPRGHVQWLKDPPLIGSEKP